MTLNRRTMMAGTLGGLMVPALVLQARASSREHQIAIRDFTFDPVDLTVQKGDRITFTNHDIAPHTATADDGSWDTGELTKGQSITLTVAQGWTGPFYCAFHPAMRAKLTIKDH